MAPASATPFTPESLKTVRRLEIRTRRLVNDLFAGRYHSTFKGRGMSFAEVREYQPGDEIRSIDWNVTARMNAPYIKQFTEERELTILLVVDASASLKFGTRVRSKHALVLELAALIAFAALRNNDKVGLLLFGEKVDRFVPPKKSKLHALRILRDLLVVEPTGRGTGLAAALALLNRVQRKRAVVFVFSDFMAEGWEKPLAVARQRHDTIVFLPEDARERAVPAAGRLELEDLETGERLLLDTTNPAVRARLAERRRAAAAHRDTTFRRLGLDVIRLDPAEPYVKPVMAFFDARAKRFR